MKIIIHTTDGNTVTILGNTAHQFLELVNDITGELSVQNVVIKENEKIRCVIYKKWITYFEVRGA